MNGNKNIVMWQNSMIRGFLNGIDVRNIKENGNSEFGAESGGDFSGECNFLNETFNLVRKPIVEYTIPDDETEIAENAFNGCGNLKKLTLHRNIKVIGRDSFDGCGFKYFYKLETGEIVLSKELLEKEINLPAIEIEKLKSVINWEAQNDLFVNIQDQKYWIKLIEKLHKSKLKIPYIFITELEIEGLLNEFIDSSNFNSFVTEMPNINFELMESSEEEQIDFLKFATILGCFSTERILDKEGKETETTLSQKATSVIRDLLKMDKTRLGRYHGLFDSMPFGTKPNQDFLKFISKRRGKEKKFENVDILLELEEKYPGIFARIMTNFDSVKEYRNILDERGLPKCISWKEAFEKYFINNKYYGITKENEDIAELFSSKGLRQEDFQKASDFRIRASEKKINKHILEIPLKEKTILECIEEIKNNTGEELNIGRKTIEDLYSKQFTYEWLSKNDPHNAILGLFVSCCGTINSQFYGANIAIASIIATDVQNLVIRDSAGKIVSKGTMYLNREKGYGVINDFELNEQYREDETRRVGVYEGDESSKYEKQRDLIFQAYKRGIGAFVEQYDRENPNKPLKQINVGMGYNRLKSQVRKYKKETSRLRVPEEYGFEDAKKGQYVLYERTNDVMEKSGEER